ncbi:MAG TPA: histone deacetylase family protein [Gammaproteobacteria bacterium]|nr:histone deacetylase family protein [Gammaproteobacteria bacterium]
MTAYLTHADCLKHEMGEDHPECPARITAIEDALHKAGLYDLLHHYEAPLATGEQLKRAHDADYVDALIAAAPRQGHVHLDGDTSMNPHSLPAALRAAGAAVRAVDLVMGGEETTAFCNIRPPGHHAERRQAMGFCLFNNVAVGAMHALHHHGVDRVAIVDFDVHHGNGTEDIFDTEPRVMLCSSFQYPLYPYKAGPTVDGHRVNVPLPAGAGGREFRRAVAATWFPQLERFQPRLIFISAGFDAHREDPLAGLNLVEQDYEWITREIMAIADRHGRGRVISTLEGGYALPALGRSAVVHIRALMKL